MMDDSTAVWDLTDAIINMMLDWNFAGEEYWALEDALGKLLHHSQNPLSPKLAIRMRLMQRLSAAEDAVRKCTCPAR